MLRRVSITIYSQWAVGRISGPTCRHKIHECHYVISNVFALLIYTQPYNVTETLKINVYTYNGVKYTEWDWNEMFILIFHTGCFPTPAQYSRNRLWIHQHSFFTSTCPSLWAGRLLSWRLRTTARPLRARMQFPWTTGLSLKHTQTQTHVHTHRVWLTAPDFQSDKLWPCV